MSAQTGSRPQTIDDGRRRLVGVAFMCLAVACFTGIDASAKWLGRTEGLHPLEISFFRYLVAFAVAAAVFWPSRAPQAWRVRRPWPQALRGLCLLGSTAFNFVALRHLQLAETMSIAFSAPLIIAALSGPVLGERVGLARWGAIALGFLGVLVIARPTAEGWHPAMLAAFANVACYAVYAVVTRRLAGVESSASMLIVSTGLPILILAPSLPFVWTAPTGVAAWVVVAIMGACGAIGHLLLIHAFSRAPAAVVAPFGYTQIVWMALAGFLVFGDLPGRATLLGGAIVVASGLLLLALERRPHVARRR